MKHLFVHDRIYGTVEITEPVMLELMNSAPMQRLKHIAQYGIPDEFYHLKNYYRYEHSVGVYVLLKSLDASKEEQIAGLLHDVSHTAFSHVVDWVVGHGKTENYQDEHHKDFIRKSEIVGILRRHNYNPEQIAEHHSYQLLDQEIPDLCADRIDYSLREISLNLAKKCFPDLITFHSKIVFKNSNSAAVFAREFLKLQMTHWGGYEAAVRYRFFANALRRALEIKLITLADFWNDDVFIIDRLKQTDDNQIIKILSLLRNKSLAHLPQSDKVVYKKFRYVDPKILVGDSVIRLSTIDRSFMEEITEAKLKNDQGIILPDITNFDYTHRSHQ